MLPFFRKIRYRLAKDNQFFKYSRYAIGEIVLVVIGILIALQINTWNEERKQRKSEIQFLKRLKSDLQNDNHYFNRRLSDSEEVDKLHFLFISKLYEEQNNLSDVIDLFQLLRLNSELFNSRNPTYKEMTFSGKLDILSNENLKSDLVNYYIENEQVAKHVEEFNNFSVDCMLQMLREIPYLERVTDWNDLGDFHAGKSFDFDSDWSFLNDVNSPKFQNVELVTAVYRNKHQTFSEYFLNLSKRSDALINAVSNELNK